MSIYFWFVCQQELLKASDAWGSVDLSRFMQLWQKFKQSVTDEEDDTEEDIKKAFKDYDVDGDGYISQDEMMRVRFNFLTFMFL